MASAKELAYLEALMAKKRQRGLDDLFFFNKYIVESDPNRRQYFVPHVHGEWTSWYLKSKKRIKMILVPRACFKSTFFTVGRTLQEIARNRDARILIANATADNAQKFLSEIKGHLRSNQEYLSLYGEMYARGEKWSESEIVVSGRSLGLKEATVTALGVESNLVSQHYSMIIADDLVNLENSATRYQSDKVIEWWKRAFSLLDYDGEMIIIGTRWSYYELYSYIMDKLSDQVDFYIRGAYRQDGSLYFPEILSEKKLQELKTLQGSYVFSAFYLNNPVDEDSALIKKSQLMYYGPGEDTKLPSNLTVFAACDPAISQEVTSDYSTIIIVGVDAYDNWYVLEVRRGTWTVGELIDNLFAVHKQWKPFTMSIEVIGQAQGLMAAINGEEETRKDYLPIIEIKARPPVTKERRIRAVLQPRFERGKIFIKRDMFELEEELLNYPKASHDDIIDPLSDIESMAFPADLESGTPDAKTEMEKRNEESVMKPGGIEQLLSDPDMGEYY